MHLSAYNNTHEHNSRDNDNESGAFRTTIWYILLLSADRDIWKFAVILYVNRKKPQLVVSRHIKSDFASTAKEIYKKKYEYYARSLI